MINKAASNACSADGNACSADGIVAKTDQEAHVELYLPLYPRIFGGKSDKRQTAKRRDSRVERFFSTHDSDRTPSGQVAKERHRNKAFLAVSKAGIWNVWNERACTLESKHMHLSLIKCCESNSF